MVHELGGRIPCLSGMASAQLGFRGQGVYRAGDFAVSCWNSAFHVAGLPRDLRGKASHSNAVNPPNQDGGMFESLIGILASIGLAASCGFRVFVPMLFLIMVALP